ncbi:MAG: sigma-70 family RNA polymerase sigma factor [Acidimicrobiales bacterium]
MAGEHVVGAARVGAEWALSSLYRDIQPALVRYLALRSPGEQEDLAADVWVEVARALPMFQGDEEDVRRLAFTIARRRSVDHHRKLRRRRTDAAPVVEMRHSGTTASAEDVAAASARSDWAIERIREVLPAEQAEIVLLRVVAGLETAEIAAVIGKKPAAVSVLQHRALRRLARHIRREDFSTVDERSASVERCME